MSAVHAGRAIAVPTSSDHDAVIRPLVLPSKRLRRDAAVAMPLVGFWNIGDGPTERKREDADRLIRRGVTVMGWSEARDRGGLYRWLTQRREWAGYRNDDQAGASAVPFVWRVDVWSLVSVADVEAGDPGAWVGPQGAGPTHLGAKVVTVVKLRHRATGQPVKFLVTHMVPSVTRPYLPTKEKRARRRHYRHHVAVIARTVRNTDVSVVLMFDSNAERGFDLLDPIHATGLDGWTREGTHGGRAIDHVLFRGPRK